VQPPSNGVDDDPVLRFILPVGQSGLAIAASYAGLFSMLLVFGPLAIVLGILALRDIKRNPKKRGKWRAIFGLVMGILGTIGLLALCAAMISSPSRS
jgi:membrane protease YdiL (CAAX protease family)